MANKYSGYGAKLQLTTDSGTTWDDIAGVLDVDAFQLALDMVEVTSHSSTGAMKEYVPGTIEPGSVSFPLVWDPADATQALLMTRLYARSLDTYRIVLPDSGTKTYEFTAYVKGFGATAPVNDKLGADVEMQISGTLTEDPA